MMKRGILIFVLSAMMAPAIASADPGPECLSDYDTTQCGYSCIAEYGVVKCAATPSGVCHGEYGKVVCWDPPRQRGRFRRRRPPKGECLAEYGMVVCGYSCVGEYGVVRCAQHPDAVCTSAYGKVTCSDDD